jgi:hypothetical protein
VRHLDLILCIVGATNCSISPRGCDKIPLPAAMARSIRFIRWNGSQGTACCPNLTRCHAIPPMVVGSTLLSKNRFDGRLTFCRARFSQVRRWLFNFAGSVRSCLYLFGAAVTIPRFGDAPTCSACGLDKCSSQVHVCAVHAEAHLGAHSL